MSHRQIVSESTSIPAKPVIDLPTLVAQCATGWSGQDKLLLFSLQIVRIGQKKGGNRFQTLAIWWGHLTCHQIARILEIACGNSYKRRDVPSPPSFFVFIHPISLLIMPDANVDAAAAPAAAGEAPSPGRGRRAGTRNILGAELVALLTLIEAILLLGANDWVQIQTSHNDLGALLPTRGSFRVWTL